MKITKQARRDAKQLFNSCKANDLLDENRVRKVVTEVVKQKPRGYVAILSHFQRLVKLDIERRAALVESAAPVSKAIEESIRSKLASRYGQGLTIQFAVNPQLIGGLRVKVGSDVFDGSVKARLAELEQSL
jgi:F-type H+-transporting ATPase subunit delta